MDGAGFGEGIERRESREKWVLSGEMGQTGGRAGTGGIDFDECLRYIMIKWA